MIRQGDQPVGQGAESPDSGRRHVHGQLGAGPGQPVTGGRPGYPDGGGKQGRNGGGGVSGGGPRQPGGKSHGSWAEMLSSTLPNSWKKNVLEVVLEKDERGSFNISEIDCAKMMQKLGLDIRPGVHVETVQICPNGRGIILITLKKEVEINQFCRYDIFDVTSSGIRVVNVKPAGKREVVVNIKNIHPNTMDDGVVNYLNKFGEVVTKKVVYGVYGEGPLKGFRNGDRAYKMEIKPGVNIGTYHVLDGQKVTLKYPGQLQTCARCHQNSRTCLGKGVARKCEEADGEKVEFGDYIRSLWNKIGYTPHRDEEAIDDLEAEESFVQQEGGHFTPRKAPMDNTEKFAGVCLKTFPREVEENQIVDLLIKAGLPADKIQDVQIKSNGNVSIRNLENEICLSLISTFHNQTHLGRKLFCNGIIPRTPEKQVAEVSSESPPVGTAAPAVPQPRSPSSYSMASCSVPTSPPPSTSQSEPVSTSSTSSTLACTEIDTTVTVQSPLSTTVNLTQTQIYSAPLISPNSSYNSPPYQKPARLEYSPADQSILELGNNDDIQQFIRDNQGNLDEQLVRRHSLSMRTPPQGSIAEEIISHTNSAATPHFTLAKTLLNNLSEMTSRLSDFESCVSSSGSETDTEKNDMKQESNQKSMNDAKRNYRQKRKNSTTPKKDFFLKKQNTNNSPDI